jgi:hypothetical protein
MGRPCVIHRTGIGYPWAGLLLHWGKHPWARVKTPLTAPSPGAYLGAMAKQTGPIFLQGTVGGLTFYKMEGRFYVRKASSLSARQWKGSPAFRDSRAAADRFGEAARLSSRVYQRVQKEARSRELYRYLKGWALLLLKEGRDRAQVEGLLLRYLLRTGCGIEGERRKSKGILLLPTRRNSADGERQKGNHYVKRPALVPSGLLGLRRGRVRALSWWGAGKTSEVFKTSEVSRHPPLATRHPLLAWRNWATEKIRRCRCAR